MRRPSDNDPVNGGSTAQEADNEGDHFGIPLGSIVSGHLKLGHGAANVNIYPDSAMVNLYRVSIKGLQPRVWAEGGAVTIEYPRFPIFDWLYYLRERSAEVALNAHIPWDIEIHDGASRLTADLRELELRSFEVNGGASRVEVTLPRPSRVVPICVLGGASNVAVRYPEGVAAKVHVLGGVTNLTFGEEHFGAVGSEMDLRSPDYHNATDRYELAIAGGANNLLVSDASSGRQSFIGGR